VLAVMAGIQAQDTRYDTIPGLIISEVRLNTNDYTYIELGDRLDMHIYRIRYCSPGKRL
jgi:hypothetical protein